MPTEGIAPGDRWRGSCRHLGGNRGSRRRIGSQLAGQSANQPRNRLLEVIERWQVWPARDEDEVYPGGHFMACQTKRLAIKPAQAVAVGGLADLARNRQADTQI